MTWQDRKSVKYWRTQLFLLAMIAIEGLILVIRNGHP